MSVKLKILFLFTLFLGFASKSGATVFEVINTNNSGSGSLRNQINAAETGDTVLINVKGTIILDSQIDIIGKGALTIIGPYPKHNKITAGGTWTGSLFNISSSGPFYIRGIGFESGNGSSRHVFIDNAIGQIHFEECLFQNNNVLTADHEGAAVYVRDSETIFTACSFIDNQCDKSAIYGNSGAVINCINSTFSGNIGNDEAGAIRVSGGTSELFMLHNTIVYNEGTMAAEAIRTTGGVEVTFEGNAVGYNGTNQQLSFSPGAYNSNGLNAVRLNYVSEPGIDIGDLVSGDVLSNVLNFHLRASILEDGYGLKYWTIVNDASHLINRAAPTISTPANDARRAPRALMGPSSTNVYPDAGACEYTHLRVTNNAGSPVNVNSFLWTLEAAQRKDEIHYIEFDLAGVSPGAIECSSNGIVSTKPYIIDGYSQPNSAVPGPPTSGSSALTAAIIHVTLRGNDGVLNGVQFNTGTQNSIIQGLRINSFDKTGIRLNEEYINIYGCEVGIDHDGTIDGNKEVGIRVGNSSGNSKIGGWEHWMRNVTTGNGISSPGEEANILIASADYNTVSGNIIGGVQDGLSTVFADRTPKGLSISGHLNTIGGTLINSGNIIVDNIHGIYITRFGDYNKIRRNKIGVGNNGLNPLGNEENGIFLVGADNNIIGSTNSENGNIIAHNLTGIALITDTFSAKYNSILGNSIRTNANQGIDFDNNFVNVPNDGSILGSTQNEGVDYPILDSSINCTAANTITHYELSVPIMEAYRVEFFSNSLPDDTHGEGETFLGFTEVIPSTNPQNFSYDHGVTLPIGTSLSATITRLSSGSTSEFGKNIAVTAPGYAEVSYSDICPGETAIPLITGDTGGNFRFSDPTPVDGAIINSSNGHVTNCVSGATYTVIYDGGGCWEEDTVSFDTFVIGDASFVYENLCPDEDGLPTSIVTSGGTFSFNPIPGDGALIDAVTGAITETTPGTTYTVAYSITDGPCTLTTTQSVEIIDNDPSFSFDNICPGNTGTPYDIATVGGSFSYYYTGPFDGSTIGLTSGTLSGGVEGTTYNIVHTVGICGAKDTVPVTITNVAEDFVFDDFCPTNLSPAPELDGPLGTFSMIDLADGATINADGTIVNPVEGTTYEVTHSLTVDGCTQSATHTTLALEVDETFIFSAICPEEPGLPTGIATPGGEFSFVTDLGDGATINPSTGLLENGVEGTTYDIKYVATVGICSDSLSVSTPITIVTEGFTFPDFCPGLTSPAPSVDEVGGVFSFVTAPGDGATIDPDNGIISAPIEGTTYDVLHTITTDGCTQDSIISVTVKTILETFIFDDFCPTEESPAPIFEGPISSISMTPMGDGATLQPDGSILLPVEGTTYTLSHTLTQDGCTQTFTADVTAIEVDEFFAFFPICPEAEGLPIGIATPGGTFSFDPDLEDGSIINPVTGLLSGGVEGTVYGIKYIASNGGCLDSSTVNVPIVNVFEGFLFPDFCPAPESPLPIIDSPGGVFTFNTPPGDGATISPTTGQITAPVEGNLYEVIYTREIAGCTQDSILSVSVISIDSDFTVEDFCADIVSPAASPETGVYSFSTPPTEGETIDPETGVITGPIEGYTYSIDRTVIEETCSETTTKTISVIGVDESFEFESYCPAPLSPSPIVSTPGGLFNLAPDIGDGASIDISSGIISNGIEGTTYAVEYSVVVDEEDLTCAESDTIYVTVIPTDESFTFNDFCAEFSGAPNLIAEPGGVFALAPDLGDGILIDSETGILTNANPGTYYTIEYTVGICGERDSIAVLALGSEDATFILDDHCSNISMLAEVGGTPGGTFSFSPEPVDGATINEVTGDISTNLIGGTYYVQYITPGSATTCADTSNNAIILFGTPEIITLDTEDDIYCPGEAYTPIYVLDFTLADEIYWMIDDIVVDSTFEYTPDTLFLGVNTFDAQAYTTDGCYSEIKSIDYLLSDTSNMSAMQDFDICLGTEAQLFAEGGISYLWQTDIPMDDATSQNQTLFSLNNETYIVTITNEEGCKIKDSVQVSFKPESECPILIYNAFSPNNDGTNDFWYIDNLINFVPNEVFIYNRWGDLLNSFENYDNINVYWSGEDKNGNPLPPGTYFYVVTSKDTQQNQASWVEIVR